MSMIPDLPGDPLTEEQRRPLIDDDGRRLLRHLLEHDAAPRYNHTCGDRLTAAGLAAVRAFDAEVRDRPGATIEAPSWVEPFVVDARARTPIYRRLGGAGRRLDAQPTVSRADLAREPWSFVPDDHALDEMVVYTTTGTTTGEVAYIASTPVTAASYIVLLRAALATRGLDLVGGPGRTAVALVCWQRRTYTYASVSSFLGQAGIVKLNLNPDDWRDPTDVARFLDALDPEIVTGDPVAFDRLAELATAIRPTALVSSAMTLTRGLAERLEARFGCPVIDVYGMNEAGPIAASGADGTVHELLQPRLHVEILDAAGNPVAPGERGEVVLTGGHNPALPLVRYRTGDHAALERRGGRAVLVGLEGRAPVPFAAADGRALNTIDVTTALTPLALARYQVHQLADLSLSVGVEAAGGVDELAVRAALERVFGAVPVTVRSLAGEPERPAFTSELELR